MLCASVRKHFRIILRKLLKISTQRITKVSSSDLIVSRCPDCRACIHHGEYLTTALLCSWMRLVLWWFWVFAWQVRDMREMLAALLQVSISEKRK